MRFRSETFGLFYPALPETRTWWRFSLQPGLLLLATFRRYRCWLSEMRTVATFGAHDWWGREWPGIDLEGELRYLERAPGERG